MTLGARPWINWVYACASILAFVASTYALLPLALDADWIATNRGLIATHLFYIFLLLLSVWAYVTKPVLDEKLPRVVKVMNEEILLVDKALWMGIGIAISIYRDEDKYERFICDGVVVNIQSNGLAQIKVINPDNESLNLTVSQHKLSIKPGQRV
jgi:hypothetical protein